MTISFNHPALGNIIFDNGKVISTGVVMATDINLTDLSDLVWIVDEISDEVLWDEKDLWFIDSMEYQDMMYLECW